MVEGYPDDQVERRPKGEIFDHFDEKIVPRRHLNNRAGHMADGFGIRPMHIANCVVAGYTDQRCSPAVIRKRC